MPFDAPFHWLNSPEPASVRADAVREPILLRLKQATAARHAAIESRSVLLDPDLSRDTYRACLLRFFGYYKPLEHRMQYSQAWSGAELAYDGRYKTPLLAQDLAALGVPFDEVEQTPLCHALPDLRTTARLFGCLYVIEGATLGGQIVTRHLQASLGVTPQTGGAFFSGYAQHTGSRWKAFGLHLSAFAWASGADDEIVAGADETFQTLDRWLHPAPYPAPYPASPPDTPHDAPASRH